MLPPPRRLTRQLEYVQNRRRVVMYITDIGARRLADVVGFFEFFVEC